MRSDERTRYNRAVGIAELIIEGHTKTEAKEEFGVAKTTIDKDLKNLCYTRFGNYEKNLKLYVLAKRQLEKNSQKNKL